MLPKPKKSQTGLLNIVMHHNYVCHLHYLCIIILRGSPGSFFSAGYYLVPVVPVLEVKNYSLTHCLFWLCFLCVLCFFIVYLSSLIFETFDIRFLGLGSYFYIFVCYSVANAVMKNKYFFVRLVALSQVEEASDLSDLELIQHMNMDLSRLTRLLNGDFICIFNCIKVVTITVHK